MASSESPITTTFATVPIPGSCRSGIQPSRTTTLITIVAPPMSSGLCSDTPWARTVQGVFPSRALISPASPTPNSQRPKPRTASVSRRGLDQPDRRALHGIVGSDRAGLRASLSPRDSHSLTAQLLQCALAVRPRA